MRLVGVVILPLCSMHVRLKSMLTTVAVRDTDTVAVLSIVCQSGSEASVSFAPGEGAILQVYTPRHIVMPQLCFSDEVRPPHRRYFE
jgi:hypothetical protein